MTSTSTSNKQPSDRLLFLRLKTKDQAAFMRAYEAHRAGIYRFIYFRVNSEAEAQDLTSTVFLKVWSVVQAGKLKDYRSLKGLLYTVARHTVIDYYRQSGESEVSLDDETAPIEVIDDRLDMQALMEQDGDLKLIYSALDQLKPEYREVIMLHFVSELSVKEIAEVIDKKPGNVRVILHRGLEALRKLTQDEGEEEGETEKLSKESNN